jgi:hypothetical protein
MPNEILSYLEMCGREGISLQKGMNFRLTGDYSVILMSVRPNAPYQDSIVDDGATIIYEGHDIPKSAVILDPKTVDQAEFTLAASSLRMVDSMKPRSPINDLAKSRRGCASMRRSDQGFGLTTDFSIWWIRGLKTMVHARCLNSS